MLWFLIFMLNSWRAMKVNFEFDTARSFWDRLFGVLFKKQKFTPLFFPHCKSVHTFFMKRPIKLIWVDESLNILKVEQKVYPRSIRFHPKAFGVIECESGQALVETALLLPFLFLFIFGFLHLSLAISLQQKLVHTTNYALMAGSLTNNDAKIIGAVDTLFPTNPPVLSIASTSPQNIPLTTEARRKKDIITLTLAKPYDLNIPFFPENLLLLKSTASAVVLCESNTHPYTCE